MQSNREGSPGPEGIADRLKRMRTVSELTGEQLAKQLGWTRSKIPKLENGRQMPSAGDIRAWARETGHAGDIPELLVLLGDAQTARGRQRHILSGRHLKNASRIRSFEVTLIPGLLQTPGYARHRAIESARLHGMADDRVEETVTAAARRQEALYDAGKAFEFVFTEAALRYLLCPPDVMRVQLNRLLGLFGLANIQLGIIPFGRHLPIAPEQGFWMADDITVIEAFGSVDILTGKESARRAEIMDGLAAEAVTGEDACRLILAALAALNGGRQTA